jgi:hypothetical protein
VQPQTCIFAVSMISAMCFGIAATAADMPKEGTVSYTYFGFGTFKANPIGKQRLLNTFDENGLTLSDGFGDHVTWHCWGTGDYTSGLGQDHGYCVGTDTAGDQLAVIISDEKHTLDAKSWSGTDTLSGGTGKFAGVSGGGPSVCHGGEFKPIIDGTYLDYCTGKWSYKLP